MDTAVTLEILPAKDIPAFCGALQTAFDKAVIEEFGPQGCPVISTAEIMVSMEAPGAEALKVLSEGTWVGGAVVRIDRKTQRNELGLLYIDVNHHGGGIGRAAWRAIELRYPSTKTWSLVTPYFEQRNIHFYVNSCGFHIVEFYNEHNPDPHEIAQIPSGTMPPGGFTAFRFEKVMEQKDSAKSNEKSCDRN